MFKHLKTKLAAEWHGLVTGTEHDLRLVLEWLLTEIEKDYDMTLEEIGVALTTLTAKVDALITPVPTDLTPVLTAIADLKTEVVNKVEGIPVA